MTARRSASAAAVAAVTTAILLAGAAWLNQPVVAQAFGANTSTAGGQIMTWPAAPPGGDQQAAEQANFNEFYQNPTYLAETNGEQRNDDLADLVLDLSFDLSGITSDQSAIVTADIDDCLAERARLPFLLGASGPDVSPIDAHTAEDLRLFAQWVDALPDNADDFRHNDPTTQQASTYIQTTAQELFQRMRYHYYISTGMTADEATRRAVNDLSQANGRARSVSLLSSQVDELRYYYNQGVSGATLGDQVNTRRSFTWSTRYFNLRHTDIRISLMTARSAVMGINGYLPGKWDKNGVAFNDPTTPGVTPAGQPQPEPLPALCTAHYVCPPLYDPR